MRTYLKKIRDEKHLTIADMAAGLDISESYYSLIEAGKRQKSMDLRLAMKLASFLKVPLKVIADNENHLV